MSYHDLSNDEREAVIRLSYHDLSNDEREAVIRQMEADISTDFQRRHPTHLLNYAADPDTYIRKNAYLCLGRLYLQRQGFREDILHLLNSLLVHPDEKVRQTAVNAFGEIGKTDAGLVFLALEKAMSDPHHSIRNAVIGTLKKMGEKNPQPTLSFAHKFIHHPDPEIRRQALHGIELRGRTHPEEVLPILAEMQEERHRRVKPMLVHVLGQISYKKGCLEKVLTALREWGNRELVDQALAEILETHRSYEKFSAKSYEEAKAYIEQVMHEQG